MSRFTLLQWSFILVLAFCTPALAINVTVPISDIPELVGGDAPDDALRAFLAQEIQKQLDAAGFQDESGILLTHYNVPAVSQTLASLCLIPRPKHVATDPSIATVTLDNNTQFNLDLADLKSISITASLTGVITLETNARVKWGQAVPFVGSCKTIGTDSGVITASLPFVLSVTGNLNLDLSYDPEPVAIVVDKHATIDANLSFYNGDIDPEFGNLSITEVLIELFENRLLDEVDGLGREALTEAVSDLNNRLNGNNSAGIPDPSITPFNGPTTFVLEQDASDLPLVRGLLDELGLPELVISLVENRGIEILAQLAVLDEQERSEYLGQLGAGLACDAVLARYQQPMDRSPLFQQSGNHCIVSQFDNDGAYFTDAQCSREVAFKPTDTAEFCTRRSSEQAGELLGNGLSWSADTDQPNDPLSGQRSRAWTLLPGTSLDLGVVSLEDLNQPFTKQLEYKVVNSLDRGNGVCSLEMRVYKKNLAATDLKPLMAIHGGTWQNRGFSFLGLESTLARFADDGFIVFAPFYRLAGDSDGNVECNGVTWREVVADIEDALTWIRDYGEALGAADTPVTVFGQSAGAHLASWLASYRAIDVERALLMYPPLDTLDFLNNALPSNGEYTEFRDFGLRALAAFFGANNGLSELRLDRLSPGLDKSSLSGDLDAVIPDEIFNLASPDPGSYLRKCADANNIDLNDVDPQSPPAKLLQCLKQDLADFLSLHSFFDTLHGVPIQVIHGSNDDLVPYQQAIRLCSARTGNVLPESLTDDLSTFTCGADSAANIVLGAEHALDLGPCIGPLCPAGDRATPSRGAVDQVLANAFAWLGLNRPQTPDSPYLATVSGDSGGPLLALVESSASITARVFDATLGSQLTTLTYFSGQWSFEQSVPFPQGNLGILASRNGVTALKVQHVTSGDMRVSYPMGAGWAVLDLVAVDANSVGFLAERISDGLPVVEVKNVNDNQRIRLVYPLNKNWRVQALRVMAVNNESIAAILARHRDNNSTIIQFRSLSTGALLGNSYPVGRGWVPREMKTTPDGRIALSMIRNSDGFEVIQLFDVATQTLIRNIYPIGSGSGTWITHNLEPVNNDGKIDIAILSTVRANGSMLTQIKDPNTGLVLHNTWFIASPWLFERGFSVIPDYSGNNVSELGVLTENLETGARMIQIRDAMTGTVLSNIPIS